MSLQRLLIVHPDPSVRSLLGSMLKTMGHRIDEAPNERAAVRMLEHHPADLVLAGREPCGTETDADAMEFLTYLRRKYHGLPVLMLCHEVRPERTREAMVRGANSVLRFPMPATQLRAAVAQALDTSPRPAGPATDESAEAASQVESNGNGHGNGHSNGLHPTSREPANGHAAAGHAVSLPRPCPPGEEILGENPMLLQALELTEAIAPTRAPVLIVGERGTGKTLLARRLHRLSPRHASPFVEVSCSTLKEPALEAELFGRRSHGLGESDRQGKVSQADGGTLYLDEVAALSPNLQFKLLRLIRDGEYEPVGSTHTIHTDCRIVVGSREDLNPLVDEDRFRSDLFYAVSVVTMKLPPLRHRDGDLLGLADWFRERFARESGKPVSGFSVEAVKLLESHDWPGNVLELKATVERAVVLCRGSQIEPGHLVLAPRESSAVARLSGPGRDSTSRGILPLKEALEGPEKQLILEALQALNWNRQETARMLDINRTTLYKKMKKYGLLFDEPVWTN